MGCGQGKAKSTVRIPATLLFFAVLLTLIITERHWTYYGSSIQRGNDNAFVMAENNKSEIEALDRLKMANGNPQGRMKDTIANNGVKQDPPKLPPGAATRRCTPEYRIKWMRETCKQNNWTNWNGRIGNQRMMFVDDRHKVIFCSNCKVASCTMKMLLVASAGRMQPHELIDLDWTKPTHRKFQEEHGIRGIGRYSPGEKQLRIRSYFKFMIVRHPLERLYSSYSFGSTGTGKWLLAKKKRLIMTHYSGNKTLYRGRVFIGSFSDFLEFVASGWLRDIHWAPYTETCNPCVMEYDYIVKMETFATDMALILKKLPGPDGQPYNIPQINVGNNKSMEDKMASLSKLYEDVDEATLNGILNIYKKDMIIFGYGWNKTSRQASCMYPAKSLPDPINGQHCC